MRPYHPYAPDQAFLMPRSLSELVRPDDPVHLVRQVVSELDLSAVHTAYQTERGRPPYHPQVMVGLLLYGAAGGSTPLGALRLPAPTMSPSCT